MSCTCEHTVQIDGSGQLDRYLKALDPNYAPVDGRDIKELLVYAKKYAGQIRFYDLPGEALNDGQPADKVSWKEFFAKDVSVIAASIGTLDVEHIKSKYDASRKELDEDPEANRLASLFNPIITIAAHLEQWLDRTLPDNDIHQDLMLAINSTLNQHMNRLRAIAGGYVVVDAGTQLPIDTSSLQNQALWGLDQNVDPDLTVYEGDSDADKIRNAALYIDGVFLGFFGYLTGLIERSETYLRASLEAYPSHQPHMALFIAFLKLFAILQDQMNGLTERMLNFYYRDVLQLVEKPSIPDKVHMVFELAKGVSEYRIAKETELDGGKDASGVDQIYRTTDEIVVNQAKVAELKTLFIEKATNKEGITSIREIHARPVANSLDGHGLAFEDEFPKWDTFGRGRPPVREPKHVCEQMADIKDAFLHQNQAALGFALASPQLVLQGGNRLIRYAVNGLDTLFQHQTSKQASIQIMLTTEEGWLTIDQRIPEELASKMRSSLEERKFGGAEFYVPTGYYQTENELYIYLPPSEAPIIPFDPNVHEGNFTTEHPVMQVVLGPTIEQREEIFKTLKFTDASLLVKVGSINQVEEGTPNMDGLTRLTLQNDAGPIDPDKVFDPFTAYPNMGKSLYIGQDEIFNKPLTALSVNVQLAVSQKGFALTDTMVAMSAVHVPQTPFKLRTRIARQWKRLSKNGDKDFSNADLTQNVMIQNGEAFPFDRKPLTYNSSYNQDTIKGFLEIQWNLPVSGNETSSSFQRMQELAELLKIKAISVSYESALSQLDTEIDQFFHVYPFGAVEALVPPSKKIESKRLGRTQNTKLESLKQFRQFEASKNQLLVNTEGLMLPNFSYTGAYVEFQGNEQNQKTQKLHQQSYEVQKEGVLKRLALETSGVNATLGIALNQYKGSIQEEGNLYIGLENLKPLQTLSLLFQFAEGSAEDEDNDPPKIHWSYLSNNEWKPLLDTQIIADGTFGFQTTGIIKFDIPKDATNNNTIITTGLHWLKASVTENAHRIPKLVDIVAQAVVAAFDDRDNDPLHFECPLPAESIGKLVIGKSEVKKVLQPFASWDGKAEQIGREFYIGVSERLKHKGRAITSWDYEHLVLDRFPSIYKVKAITHTDSNCLCRDNTIGVDQLTSIQIEFTPNGTLTDTQEAILNELLILPPTTMVSITAVDHQGDTALVENIANTVRDQFIARGFAAQNISVELVTYGQPFTMTISLQGESKQETFCCGPQIAPGHVLVVPISDFKNRNAIDPLQPKTSRRTLLEIEAYLKQRTSPFVKVHARNPVYEPIMVFFRVRFHEGLDRGYYLKQLNDELVRYLTPWAFDADADVRFDQKIYASSIINFIEERSYVDFIKDFFMGVCKESCCDEPKRTRPGLQDKDEPVHELEVVGNDFNTKGKILDAHTEQPLVGVSLSATGLPEGALTDADGTFTMLLEDRKEIQIEYLGYSTKTLAMDPKTERTIYLYPEENKELPSASRRPLAKEVEYEREEDESLEALFSRLCGCADVEKELADGDFIGETVILPSTNRSILVSVPKHLIIPCEAEERPNPCEQRKLQRQKLGPMAQASLQPKTAAEVKATLASHFEASVTTSGTLAKTKAVSEAKSPTAKVTAKKRASTTTKTASSRTSKTTKNTGATKATTARKAGAKKATTTKKAATPKTATTRRTKSASTPPTKASTASRAKKSGSTTRKKTTSTTTNKKSQSGTSEKK